MRRSLAASAILHLLLAAAVVAIGALGRELPPQDMPISVEIVSNAQLAQPSPLPPKAPVAAAAPKPAQQAATPAPRPPAPKAETKPESEPPPTKAAAKVERRVAKSAAAQILSSRIGQTFSAIVTGASEKGTWVRIRHPTTEGRVVRGERGLDVGDHVTVKLLRTDIDRGFIDFAAPD